MYNAGKTFYDVSLLQHLYLDGLATSGRTELLDFAYGINPIHLKLFYELRLADSSRLS